MADAAASFLLEQVKDIVKCHVELMFNAEKEFQNLIDDLDKLKEHLKVVEKDEHFKIIEREIREAIYDVEDTIDTCLSQANAAKGRKSSGLKRIAKTKFDLAKLVKTLREGELKKLLDKSENLYLTIANRPGNNSTSPQQRTKDRKDPMPRRDKVVGFEDEEKTLTNHLMEKKETLDVISIIGMPGLGKTTLAWKIFQKESICYEFPVRIWVSVSEKFNHRDVFLKILKKFTIQDMSGCDDVELGQTVRSCLEKGRFLLVMDDVWSVEAWEAIKDVLPLSNGESKVLVTSRERLVGARANVDHSLRFLTADESWQLLQLEAFGNLKKCPEELKEIGERIAKQCDGVPLTIVVIGGILMDLSAKKGQVTSLVRKGWEEVAGDVNAFLEQDEQKRVSKAVELSYKRLPEHLRECFLYIGVFPEDHDIPARTLTRLWIAEGFIRPMLGKSLEDAAQENLDDLISRNLLMVHEINPMREVKICRVHDMIRAFCISKALDQNLFREIRKSKDGVLEPQVSEVKKFHRLCFHSDLSKFLSAKPKGPRVRSFLCFYKDAVDLDQKHRDTILEAFELLRVLDSKAIKFQQFPSGVTKLIHLKYLTLCVDGLKLLPEPMYQLWNLQTLVVETKSRLITMKANIWRMSRMRHLKTKAAIELDTEWKGEAGENLQTLTTLSPKSFTEDMIKKARNLKTLGFRGNIATLFDGSSMSLLDKMQSLERLKLISDLPYESTSEDVLLRLPQTNCFPPNLKRLTLSKASLVSWNDMMSILARIRTLEVLKLKENSFTGIEWNAAVGDGFENLQYLLVVKTDLVIWKASTNYFPRLRCLVLKNCEELQEIPGCLAKTLEILNLTRVSKSAVESAKRIEKEKKQAQEQEKDKWGMVRFKLSVDRASETQSN